MLSTRLVASIFQLIVSVLGAGVVCGQDFPGKPIRIYTLTPGGVNDLTARLIGSGVGENTGWSVVVDNRPTLSIAAEIVAKAPPDGYALLVSTGGLWIAPFLEKVPYDPVRDFLPITITTRAPNILVVHPSLPVKTVKDLIALAKARPGQLNYGAGSVGGADHLAGALFKSMAGVDIVFVPFKSGGSAAISLVSGDIQVMFSGASTISPYIKSGRVRGVAVSSAEPTALFPGVPTVAAMLPGYETSVMVGIFAPAKTPAVIINRLNREFVKVINQANIKERLLSLGAETIGSTPEGSAGTIKSEMVKWGKVIKDAGIRAD